MARRLVAETGMPFMTEDQSVQQFAAGKLGILFASTALVRGAGDMIGGRFKWTTGPYPMADKANGGVTTGGNAMVIVAKDPAKQKAAWEYVKFATGPVGQTIAVRESGYMPTNLKALEPDHRSKFYEANPDWTTSVKQWPVARLWFGYPGASGLGVWREQKAALARIMRGETTPAAGLADLVTSTEKLAAQ